MTFVTRLFLLLSLVTFTSSMSPSALFAFHEPVMSIKTGDVTGVYYAAGSAITKLHNKKTQRIQSAPDFGSFPGHLCPFVGC